MPSVVLLLPCFILAIGVICRHTDCITITYGALCIAYREVILSIVSAVRPHHVARVSEYLIHLAVCLGKAAPVCCAGTSRRTGRAVVVVKNPLAVGDLGRVAQSDVLRQLYVVDV